MHTALIARNFAGGIGQYVWDKTGPEGAIEVPMPLAAELLQIDAEDFFVVEAAKPVAKAEKKAAPKAEEVEVKDEPVADLTDALEAASPTKRRAK